LIVDNNREKEKQTNNMGEVLTEQEKLGARNERAVKPLVFAYYVTGHGLGHATRVIEVARHLCGAGHEVHIVTVAPEFVFRRDIPSPKLHIRKVLLDCGAVQSDALTVDCLGSLEQYSRTAVVNRTALLAVEVEWLQSIKANLVVSDIVPIACKAAAQVGIPSVCVSNFSWDFIYSEYVTVAGNDHRSIVWQVSLWLQESLSETLVVLLLRLLRELLLHSQQSVE
jgi:L-arabinokinase